jgi:hypothetical protein
VGEASKVDQCIYKRGAVGHFINYIALYALCNNKGFILSL